MTKTDPTLLITDDHQRGEGESASTLNRRGDAIDVHQLLDDVGIGAFFGCWATPVATAPLIAFTAAAL